MTQTDGLKMRTSGFQRTGCYVTTFLEVSSSQGTWNIELLHFKNKYGEVWRSCLEKFPGEVWRSTDCEMLKHLSIDQLQLLCEVGWDMGYRWLPSSGVRRLLLLIQTRLGPLGLLWPQCNTSMVLSSFNGSALVNNSNNNNINNNNSKEWYSG